MISTAITFTEREKEIALAGGITGMFFSIIAVSCIAFLILYIIAGWRIFTKAGYAGWKSIIPIYSDYIRYKIAKVSFWIWYFIPLVASIVIYAIVGPNPKDPNTALSIITLVVFVYAVIGAIKFVKGLAKSFGKGTGFALGLFFFPDIFQLILGFGKAKYVKKK